MTNVIWFDEDYPILVLWMNTLPEGDQGQGWGRILGGHSFGGFSCNSLNGYVKVLNPSSEVIALLQKIANEEFCKGCTDNLSYGVTPEHKAAYTDYLCQHGMEPGAMNLL